MCWKDTRNHRIPYMMMKQKGRFKSENNLWWHFFSLADQTKSGIPERIWIFQVLYIRCDMENQEGGGCFLGTTG